MGGFKDKGWVSYGDVEIFNNERALSYAFNGGLSGISWDYVADTPECSCWASRTRPCDDPSGQGLYSEGDPIVYTLPSGMPLPDRIPALGTGDVAPWYSPTVPASNDFYGVYVSAITGLDTVPYSRTVAQTGVDCGGVLRRANISGREMVVSAVMFAGSCEGMEYGKRWLNDMLLGCGGQADCSNPEMIVQIMCPDPSADINAGLRRLTSVGVIQMPQYRDQQNSWCCNISEFNMIFYAESPYLNLLEEELIVDNEGFDFTTNFSAVCCDDKLACFGRSSSVARIVETPTFVTSSTFLIEIEPGCFICGCPDTVDSFVVSGNLGSYVSTPDSVGNSVTGDIDIRVGIANRGTTAAVSSPDPIRRALYREGVLYGPRTLIQETQAFSDFAVYDAEQGGFALELPPDSTSKALAVTLGSNKSACWFGARADGTEALSLDQRSAFAGVTCTIPSGLSTSWTLGRY